MRVVLVTSVRSRVGGTEAYVEMLAASLHRAGHQVALWHEFDGTPERGMIAMPPHAPTWSAESLGRNVALAAARSWRPDIVFSNGVGTPEVEASLLELGPAVLFAHAYYGACISGGKSRLSPMRTPCDRPLGRPCLLHYLPRRCGGLNPVTMLRQYALETGRRDLLPRYAAILTASPHMRTEYLKYDLPPDKVHAVGLMIEQHAAQTLAPPAVDGARPDGDRDGDLARQWRLLFIARLTKWKGGHLAIEALAHLRSSYDGRVIMTVAGEGPERRQLEREGRELERRVHGVEIRFTGWLDAASRSRVLQETDLLVIPSVWPEPFGLVGPEAGLFAVPTAAFDVGGISAWLREDVNGHLAPGAPPTARGLADAIVRSLCDPLHHARLRTGALESARRLTADAHVSRVVPILERVMRSAALTAAPP